MREKFLALIDHSFNTPAHIIEQFHQLVKNQPQDFYGKKSSVAHVTGSAMIVNEDFSKVLLTLHEKFNIWLQLGGHWMDEEHVVEDILQASLREVREEAFNKQQVPMQVLNQGKPLDLDIHKAGNHMHYDVCFLVQIDSSIPVCKTPESKELEWTDIAKVFQQSQLYNDALVRRIEKSLSFKPTPSYKSMRL